jgi:glycosyltransferase involved in cell wall biosynthesis
MLISIIIRTLNEERYLPELLSSLREQDIQAHTLEIIVVDSGSSDNTVSIAEQHHCKISPIAKSDFTFGRSLNLGAEASSGDVLVMISGHCVPVDSRWLLELIAPIACGSVGISYGRQIGRDTTKFSERMLFSKFYPDTPKVPQAGFFCNNANSAVARSVWEAFRFDERLTGLEDMELGKRFCGEGGRIGYVSSACVYHIHDETWLQSRHRYDREAFALQRIMPELNVRLYDCLRYFAVAVVLDFLAVIKSRMFLREALGIMMFRSAQYIGTFKGSRRKGVLSKQQKELYFYPTKSPQDH